MIKDLRIRHLPEAYIVEWKDEDYIIHSEKFEDRQTAINFKVWLLNENYKEIKKQVVSESGKEQKEGDIIGEEGRGDKET